MPAGGITPAILDEWYLGSGVNLLPPKHELAQDGFSALLHGWTPERPIISSDTRVIGVGSCFAQYFVNWLAENGFNRKLDDSPHNALIRYGAAFENPAVIAQQFRWAFEGLGNASLTWIGKDKSVFEATEQRRSLVRETLRRTDVLILTLGLSEVWYDRETGEPLWRALTKRHYDPARHVFRVDSLDQTQTALETIERLRREHLPDMKIVFTISPVRLRATFRPVSAVTANSASKAILRATLDEFLRNHSDRLNHSLFYFPSYEIVQDGFCDAFESDNRHIRPSVAAQVVRCFAEHFCDETIASTDDREEGGGHPPGGPESRIAELEARVTRLQQTCDERQAVITTLEAAARERLALIELLDRECGRLRKHRSAG